MNLVDLALRKFTKRSTWLDENITRVLIPGEGIAAFLRDWLGGELNALSGLSDPDFRLKALKTETWSFRWTTASLRMYQPGAFPLLPFYDPRLVDFFCVIPTEYVKGRRLQIEYLKRYAPDLVRITWQPYDANLYWYKRHNDLLLPRRAVKKLLRRLNGKLVTQRNWEVQFLSPGGRQALEDALLKDGVKIHSLIPQASIAQLLRDFYAAPSPGAGYALCMLLTFTSWLEPNG